MSAPAEIASPATTPKGWRATFSSLSTRNYRLFAFGQLFSNIGGWVQRIAQDWLVLTLTGSATAVGITAALQCLPPMLFGLAGGLIADRYSKRRVLLVTQSSMAVMATVLAVLTLTHTIQPWHVYLVAFGLGSIIAIDSPSRLAFVNEMVGPTQVRNAVSLNSSIYQLGGLVGPAVSGVFLAAVGAGYSFAINAISYTGPIAALLAIRDADLFRGTEAPARGGGQVRDALRYVADHPDVLWPTVLIGSFTFFGANLPVTLSAYAKSVFHSGAAGYGLLSSVVAVGALAGALISARSGHIRLRSLVVIGGALTVAYAIASAAPGQETYAVVLVAVGAGTLLLYTSANSMVQLASDGAIRGRVTGVYLVVFTGTSAAGGPLLGYIDQHAGPQAGMLLAGLVPAIATVFVAACLGRERIAVRWARITG